MKPKYSDPTEQKEIEVDNVPFEFDGKRFTVSTTVIHNLTEENVGIGWYEYWGHNEYDGRTWLTSNLEDAEFDRLEIFEGNDDMPIANPCDELVKAAEEAAYHESYERAEDLANNP